MYTIGITMDSCNLGAQIFNNGLRQNAVYLYLLFKNSGHNPFWLVPKKETFTNLDGTPNVLTYNEILSNDDVSNKIDIVLEVGIALGTDLISHFKNNNIARVSIKYGNEWLMSTEHITFNIPYGENHFNIVHDQDAIWISPHFEESIDYFKCIYLCDVNICPYIWDPFIIQKPIYTNNENKPNIVIMEPNLNFCKSSLIPIMIVDQLWRLDPNSFNKCYIVNGDSIKDKNYFKNNLQPSFESMKQKHEKVYFCPRASFNDCVKNKCVILCHQCHCELNYVYLEALHCNIPLIHNSNALKKAGIDELFYNNLNVFDGVEKIQFALNNYENCTKYNDKVKEYNSSNENNINGYVKLVEKAISTFKDNKNKSQLKKIEEEENEKLLEKEESIEEPVVEKESIEEPVVEKESIEQPIIKHE